MIFLHNEGDLFVGWFRQNSLLRMSAWMNYLFPFH